MNFHGFEVVIEREAEGASYLARSPSLPDCFGNGRTIEDAKRDMREAVTRHVSVLLAHGAPVPRNERRVHVEEVAIGIP